MIFQFSVHSNKHEKFYGTKILRDISTRFIYIGTECFFLVYFVDLSMLIKRSSIEFSQHAIQRQRHSENICILNWKIFLRTSSVTASALVSQSTHIHTNIREFDISKSAIHRCDQFWRITCSKCSFATTMFLADRTSNYKFLLLRLLLSVISFRSMKQNVQKKIKYTE